MDRRDLTKKLAIVIVASVILLFTVLAIFEINVFDIRQSEGLSYPRAIPTTGQHFGKPTLKHKVVMQTFKPKADNISGFAIFFSKKSKREKIGNLDIYLKKKEGSKFVIVRKVNEGAEAMQVPSFNAFYFDKVKTEKNKEYAIVVRGKGLYSGLTPFASMGDSYKEGAAYLNNKKSNRDIVFQTYYKTSLIRYFSKNSSFSPALLILLIAITAVGSAIVLLSSMLFEKS